MQTRSADAVILRRNQHVAGNREVLAVARGQLGILPSDHDEIARDRTGRGAGGDLGAVRPDRQQAGAGREILEENVGLGRRQLGIVVEHGVDAVTDRAAVDEAAKHVVIGRDDDLAIDDPCSLCRIKAEIAAQQHRDRILRRTRDRVDQVVVAGRPGARRAADGAADRHHLVPRSSADRNLDVEQPVRETEVHHLARDIGVAAVDPRDPAHLDIGGDHREVGILRQRGNLRAGADQYPRGRSGRTDERKVAAVGEVGKARRRGVERGQQQASDIERRGAADQQTRR